jgi:ribosomal protein L5
LETIISIARKPAHPHNLRARARPLNPRAIVNISKLVIHVIVLQFKVIFTINFTIYKLRSTTGQMPAIVLDKDSLVSMSKFNMPIVKISKNTENF